MNSSPPSPALTPAHSKNTPYTPPTSTSPSPHTLIPLTNSPSSLVPDSNPPALQKSQSTAKISNSNFFDQLENARDLLVVAVSRIVGENWKNASPEVRDHFELLLSNATKKYHAAKYPGDKIAPIKRGTTSEHPLQLKVEATTAKKAKVETPTPLLPMASSSTGITRTTTTNDSDNEEEASHESEAEHLKLPSSVPTSSRPETQRKEPEPSTADAEGFTTSAPSEPLPLPSPAPSSSPSPAPSAIAAEDVEVEWAAWTRANDEVRTRADEANEEWLAYFHRAYMGGGTKKVKLMDEYKRVEVEKWLEEMDKVEE